jgi:holo-[acyl-carrier protein] synthase
MASMISRWSIKEAVYKALYPHRKLTWKEITIDREIGGGTVHAHKQGIMSNYSIDWYIIVKPKAVFAGQDKSLHIHISVSHDGNYAVAYAVIEKI